MTLLQHPLNFGLKRLHSGLAYQITVTLTYVSVPPTVVQDELL